MKQRKSRYPSTNPFLAWTRLALKTSEMMMASAQVISHRTGRLAMAGANPNARDRQEFTRMGQEKIDAVAESAQAVAARMMLIPTQIGTIAFKQMMNGTSGIIALTTSPAVALSAKGQVELFRDAMTNSATIASQLSDSVAHLAHQGLKPIHTRATGNAKRLLKR